MANENEAQVEFYLGTADETDRAAENCKVGTSRISKDHISAVQKAIHDVIASFQPPPPRDDGGIGLESVELEIGFKLEASSNNILKLILIDCKGEASISAKVTWRRR